MADPMRSLAAKKAAATRARNKALGITGKAPIRGLPGERIALSPTAYEVAREKQRRADERVGLKRDKDLGFSGKKQKAPKAPKPKPAKPPRVVPVLTPRAAPSLKQSAYSKLKPKEHEARQSAAVLKADGAVLHAFAMWRKYPTKTRKATLDAALEKQHAARAAAYKAAGLRYTRPKTYQEKRKSAAERRRKVDREAQAKALYGAARQEDRTFRARQYEQIAVEKHHRGQIGPGELDKAKRHVKRTQHADWLRMLRREGLTEYRGSVKRPPK